MIWGEIEHEQLTQTIRAAWFSRQGQITVERRLCSTTTATTTLLEKLFHIDTYGILPLGVYPGSENVLCAGVFTGKKNVEQTKPSFEGPTGRKAQLIYRCVPKKSSLESG